MKKSIVVMLTFCFLCTISFGRPLIQEKPKSKEIPLKGFITVSGKPLTAGRVLFHDTEGQIFGAIIDKDGSYRIKYPKTGRFKITIDGVGIPPKYTSYADTDLQFEVRDFDDDLVFNIKGEL